MNRNLWSQKAKEKFYLSLIAKHAITVFDNFTELQRSLNRVKEEPNLRLDPSWLEQVEGNLFMINDVSQASASEKIPFPELSRYQAVITRTGLSGKALVTAWRTYLKTGGSKQLNNIIDNMRSFERNLIEWMNMHKVDHQIRKQAEAEEASSIYKTEPEMSALDMVKSNRARHNALAREGEKWTRPEKEEAKYVVIDGRRYIEVNGKIEFVQVTKSRIEKVEKQNNPKFDI